MGVYVKDNAGNIKKLAGYITQKMNTRWFLCTRSLEDGIEYYDVPQSAEEYYKTIDAYTIYSFGFAETNTTNYPKLRYGTTILDIKDVTNARNRIEIGQLNGVYSMYTQDLVADPKMYFVGTTNLDNSSSDYKIVTTEPEDKSQGKMIYEKSSGSDTPFQINKLKIADGTKYNSIKDLVNAGMQEKLTAGTGITIENNIISATAQETQIDNSTITKSADGKLQAVAMIDTTDNKTLTAEQIWLACSIEREV